MKLPQPHHAAIMVLGLCLLVTACASQQIVDGRVYPQNVKRGTTLDIQVIRRTTRIELTNTTARSFGPSTIWLNGRFSHRIDAFPIGETLTLSLRDFKDEFGDTFRAGGFFATERPDLLALAELQPDASNEMFGLIVVRGEE